MKETSSTQHLKNPNEPRLDLLKMDVVRWSLWLTFSIYLQGCWRLPSVTQHVLSAYALARKAYRQDDASTSDQEERRKPWSLHMIKTTTYTLQITIDSSRYSQLLIFMGGGRGTIWYYMILYDTIWYYMIYIYIYMYVCMYVCIINVDFLHYLTLFTLVYHFLPTPPSDVSLIFTIRGWTCHQESLDDISTAASTSLGDGFEW